jgi:hypothetical protein
MGYKLLGFVVWRAAKWYVRRSYGRYLPSRRVVAAGAVSAIVLALAFAGRRQATA